MTRFHVNVVCSLITLSLWGAAVGSGKELRNLVRTGSEFVPSGSRMTGGREPTCEQLRSMWRFSRRQSRAAEVTNEIPTYKDPFVYNVWESYPKVRSVIGRYPSYRLSSKPVYGKIVKMAPSNHPRFQNEEARRRGEFPSFRVPGGQSQVPRLVRKGSFQHLKELIWAERARELQERRMREEVAAKSGWDRSAHQYDDSDEEDDPNYRYLEEEERAARLRQMNGEPYFDTGNGNGYDSYERPYGQR